MTIGSAVFGAWLIPELFVIEFRMAELLNFAWKNRSGGRDVKKYVEHFHVLARISPPFFSPDQPCVLVVELHVSVILHVHVHFSESTLPRNVDSLSADNLSSGIQACLLTLARFCAS